MHSRIEEKLTLRNWTVPALSHRIQYQKMMSTASPVQGQQKVTAERRK